jgi:hypothetical protein
VALALRPVEQIPGVVSVNLLRTGSVSLDTAEKKEYASKYRQVVQRRYPAEMVLLAAQLAVRVKSVTAQWMRSREGHCSAVVPVLYARRPYLAFDHP